MTTDFRRRAWSSAPRLPCCSVTRDGILQPDPSSRRGLPRDMKIPGSRLKNHPRLSANQPLSSLAGPANLPNDRNRSTPSLRCCAPTGPGSSWPLNPLVNDQLSSPPCFTSHWYCPVFKPLDFVHHLVDGPGRSSCADRWVSRRSTRPGEIREK